MKTPSNILTPRTGVVRKRYMLMLISLFLTNIAEAGPSAPCEPLHHISATNRRALRAINSLALPAVPRGPAWKKKYDKLQGVLDANQWPFSFSTTDQGLYTFKPADFDGDGRIDALRAECGASSWNRICTLYLDRGGPKPLELEDGWMYVARVNNHFYVVMDWYGPEAGGSGAPDKDFSNYYRITSSGFRPICNSRRSPDQ